MRKMWLGSTYEFEQAQKQVKKIILLNHENLVNILDHDIDPSKKLLCLFME